jgi:exonuclease VII large subunit
MVAIGHTSNQSVLDTVANISAKTPSDGAYILIHHLRNLENQVDTLREQISKYYTEQIEKRDTICETLKNTINRSITHTYRNLHQQIDQRYSAIMRYESKDPSIRLYNLQKEKLNLTQIKKLQINEEIFIQSGDITLKAIITHLE